MVQEETAQLFPTRLQAQTCAVDAAQAVMALTKADALCDSFVKLYRVLRAKKTLPDVDIAALWRDLLDQLEVLQWSCPALQDGSVLVEEVKECPEDIVAAFMQPSPAAQACPSHCTRHFEHPYIQLQPFPAHAAIPCRVCTCARNCKHNPHVQSSACAGASCHCCLSAFRESATSRKRPVRQQHCAHCAACKGALQAGHGRLR